MITGDMLLDLTIAETHFVNANHHGFAINHAAKGCILRTTTTIEILPNEVMTHYVPIPDRMDPFRYYLVRNAPEKLQAIAQGPGPEQHAISSRSYNGKNRYCYLPTIQMGVSGDSVESVY